MDDERVEKEDPEDEAPGEDEAPPPATWAGRQGWSGLPEGDQAEDAGEHERPEASEDAETDQGPEAAGEADTPDEPEEPGEADEEPAPGATVEADTVALADAEAAREAALEGLRNRTAEHAAKRGITDPGRAPAPSEAEGPEKVEAEPPQPEPADEPATAVAASAPQPAAAPAKETPPKTGLGARFVAASLLIVASMATATAVSILVYLTDIAKGLGGLDLAAQLDAIDEEAQNFLIIGSDVRPGQSSKGLSDTTMLLRVDPDRQQITQLSIPRDLKVNIPGHGVDRFNAAYSYGGPGLTLKVVKQITGDRIPINHVVNVDFNGFADAVDAIGCVYMDVDRHYFNDNSTAATLGEQYAEIDIQAGYQRLCGLKALQYVRYRHEDNDIVRAARQQGFLREARQKVPPNKLLDERDKLLDIFTDYTTSDIDDSGTLVGLFKLMLDARGAGITQIDFPFDSLDAKGYVTAGDRPLRQAVNEFLGTGGPSGGSDGDGSAGAGEGSQPKRKAKPKPKPKPERQPEQEAAAQMIDTSAAGQQYAALIRDQGGGKPKLPVLYPTRILPQSTINDDTRYFGIDGGNDRLFHGYKFVVSMPGTTYPTAYYGVSGTDWLGAPLFANPSARRKIGKREYRFYYDGPSLRMLAFERNKTMYWVTNTLDKLLSEPQMIAIAQNLREAGT